MQWKRVGEIKETLQFKIAISSAIIWTLALIVVTYRVHCMYAWHHLFLPVMTINIDTTLKGSWRWDQLQIRSHNSIILIQIDLKRRRDGARFSNQSYQIGDGGQAHRVIQYDVPGSIQYLGDVRPVLCSASRYSIYSTWSLACTQICVSRTFMYVESLKYCTVVYCTFPTAVRSVHCSRRKLVYSTT